MADLHTRRIRILAVDDDPQMLDLFHFVFRTKVKKHHEEDSLSFSSIVPEDQESLAATFELAIAKSADDAVQMVRSSLNEASPVALAFVEVRLLSGEDGVQIAERIREADPSVNLILLADSEGADTQELAWRVPPPDKLLYILKPVEAAEILHLASAFSAKWNLERQLRRICSELQTRIQDGVAELTELNEQLKDKISEHARTEAALRKNEHFLEGILDSIQDGITVLDRDMNVVRANQTIQKWHPNEFPLIGKKCYTAYHGLQEPCPDCPAVEAIRKGSLHMKVLSSTTLDGTKNWHEVYVFPIMEPLGECTGVVEYIRDITDKLQAQEQLVRSAIHDKTTDLPNRALFMDRVEQVLRRARRHPDYMFAVMIVDLDRFKVLNDSLGHTVGDDLLRAIGQRLLGCVRTGDTVARLGGDEFGMLLDGIRHISDATRVAERVQQDISKPFWLGDHEVFTSASIGIALNSAESEQPDDLLRNADTAMFRAKALGKSRHEIFDLQMHQAALKQLQLENDLRRAVERKEWIAYYQPVIDLETGRIVGFESLVRWQHPERGLVSPLEFIPLAEETGLIVGIGGWMLRESCRQLKQWQGRFSTTLLLSVSVNLSGKQLAEPDLQLVVKQALTKSGLEPTSLRLEITESEVMQHAESVVQKLEALKKLNTPLYVDDFGTGYSSLSYLHQFPIDALKIDRSFVKDLKAGDEKSGIVKTIVLLAKDLGLNVIVEGIENAEQLQVIRNLKCEYAQGFLFSKPLPPDEAEQLLQKNPVW